LKKNILIVNLVGPQTSSEVWSMINTTMEKGITFGKNNYFWWIKLFDKQLLTVNNVLDWFYEVDSLLNQKCWFVSQKVSKFCLKMVGKLEKT